jgi:transcriptional regulator with XRE-family HTH domain
MNTWIDLLKRLKDRGWTQTQIADHVGATQSTISELSQGKAKEPRYSVASALIALDASQVKPVKVSA